MIVPRFEAEASLYRTKQHYGIVGHGFVSERHTAIIPQSCGFLKGLRCSVELGSCALACVITGGVACASCLLGLTLDVLTDCRDCASAALRPIIDAIVGNSSGGTGGHLPPTGTGRRCCEWDENGKCTLSVGKNQLCP